MTISISATFTGCVPGAGKLRECGRHPAAPVRHALSQIGREDWTKYARRTFKEADGRLVADYDVKLGTILTEVDLNKPLPTMWKEFDALAHLPVMVIRGGNSDILSAATVGGDASAPSGLAGRRGAGPGPRTAAGGSGCHRPHCEICRGLRRPGALIRRTIPSQCRITARFTKEGPPAVARRGLEVEPKIARSGDHG